MDTFIGVAPLTNESDLVYYPNEQNALHARLCPCRASLSDGATLPLYLREDFAQSFERERPHEMIDWAGRNRGLEAEKSSWFQYRYLDSGETVTVPNDWYTQTLAMRISHWRWHLQYRQEREALALKELARVEAVAKISSSRDSQRTLREHQRTVEAYKEMTLQAQSILEDVEQGRRFI
jgi:hypothetical protein